LSYPTVISDVAPDMTVYSEETFSTVAVVIPAEDGEEAIKVANGTRYGLSAGVITNDFNKWLEIAERADSVYSILLTRQ
jgi:acyl-CoA reductase-like NAD-dependent aldehyde dehydrogenase